jgi:ankyrin repeat protein
MAEQHISPAAEHIWKSAEEALIAGDVRALERLLREHERLFREGQPPAYNAGGLAPDYSGGDARTIILRNHHFDNWDAFADYSKALTQEDSPVARFETAVDAIVSGDVAALERLLRDDPALIRARSPRRHHSTLLNYVGANGIEAHRQKTPMNAMTIAETLLAAGADVDAVGDMYGGTTTLGLVATSVHPLQAGVQPALIELLIEHGAAMDRAVAPDYRAGNFVDACLANGRPEAAEYLARRGAPLTLAGAAGVGRLDLVEQFFDEAGRLNSSASPDDLRDAFEWACGHGRTSVVEFLIRRGFEPHAKLGGSGRTGLHSAAVGGHVDVIKVLLDRQVPIDPVDDSYKSTPLGWALHGCYSTPEKDRQRFYEVANVLLDGGAAVNQDWFDWNAVAADARMLAILRRADGR